MLDELQNAKRTTPVPMEMRPGSRAKPDQIDAARVTYTDQLLAKSASQLTKEEADFLFNGLKQYAKEEL